MLHRYSSRFVPTAIPPAVALGVIVIGILVVTLSFAASAPAAMPELYRQAWNDSDFVKRIDADIERYRKGDAAIAVTYADGRPASEATLEIRQKTHEFLFGANSFVLGQLDTPEKNRKWEDAYVKLFNFTTVAFYWNGIEPKPGELRFRDDSPHIWRRPPPDSVVAFAQKHGITLKGHPVVWDLFNPEWVPKDADALKKAYEKRMAEIAERYAGDIKMWDVVNESIQRPNTYTLHTPDRNRGYVVWSFEQAHRFFRPDNLLLINDAPPIAEDAKRDPYYLQVQQLLKEGVGVEGIGIQFHFYNAGGLQEHLKGKHYAPAKMLKDYFDGFSDLGLPVLISEISIPSALEDGEAIQAEVIRNLYRLWFSVPGMTAITYWNLADGTAMGAENNTKSGFINENLDPKKSFLALDQLINHDWKTVLLTKADASGKASFRGFYGKYSVKVTAGDKSREFEVDLSKDGPAQHKLVISP